MNIGKPKKKDIPTLTKLFLDSFFAEFDDIKITLHRHEAEDIVKLYLDVCKPYFLVAKEKNKIIGFSSTVADLKSFWPAYLKRLPQWYGNYFNGKYEKTPAYFFGVGYKRMIHIMPMRMKWFFTGPFMLVMGVSKQARGKGVAHKLVGYTLKQLKKQGASQITTQIREDNFPCVHVIEDCGFSRIQNIKYGHLTIGIFRRKL